MSARDLTKTSLLVGAIVVAIFVRSAPDVTPPTPAALQQANTWGPTDFPPSLEATDASPDLLTEYVKPSRPVLPPDLKIVSAPIDPLPAVTPSLVTRSRTIASGETLDAVLADAGLSAAMRAEAALAIAAEYDLRQLRPGVEVTIVTETDGTLRRLALAVEDGVLIEAIFGDAPEAAPETRMRRHDTEIVIRAGEARVEPSLYAALDAADLPARFAVDLAQMLAGTVDFSRALSGDETLRVMWSEARVGDEVIGRPQLTFATLDLGDTLFEVFWPEDGSGRATIY